jgi:predicted XRE-type DNA-binding protein
MGALARVTHVSEPGTSLLVDLGFTPDEARRFHAESPEHIDQTVALKEQLMGELKGWIEEHQLTQSEVAEILRVVRPRVSDVVNRKCSKFTIDALVAMLTRIGKPVKIVVG